MKQKGRIRPEALDPEDDSLSVSPDVWQQNMGSKSNNTTLGGS